MHDEIRCRHLDEQCQTSSCKPSNSGRAQDKGKKKEDVIGRDGCEVVEAEAKADR